jgi:hypothetical protein
MKMWILVPLALMAGCGDQGVSDSTRAERRDLAFDVSGQYAEDAAAGVPSVLTIKNEKGLSDIAAVLELRGGLRAADRDALEVALRRGDAGIAEADVQMLVGKVEASLTSLTLGEGATFTERGGENVATDHAGDLAEIALRKSLGEVGKAGSATYAATVSLFLTGYRSPAHLDAAKTAYTDDQGVGSTGVKGLLVTLTRTDAGGATKDVVKELPLTLGSLLKI